MTLQLNLLERIRSGSKKLVHELGFINNPLATTHIQIRQGYHPGVVGRITELHACYYSQHVGFGQFFESQVAIDIADFVGRLDHPVNQLWTAWLNDKIVGSIAIDGEDLGPHQAHLRWFILDDACRGYGIGRQLLAQAVQFCDQHDFTVVYLWTFKGLDAARWLYESFRFELISEQQGTQWGTSVAEQKFARVKNI